MNTNNLYIESKDINIAQEVCSMISNDNIRNRAVANVIAGNIAGRFFDQEKFNVDTESGLHNIGSILERIDISDIYINNNYIDVRVFFNQDELCIPYKHFQENILPIAYMFIKLKPDLSEANVMGFIVPENINKNNIKDDYLYIDENDLVSFYDIEGLLYENNTYIEISDKEIFEYTEGSLEESSQFISKLLYSKDSRIKLQKTFKAQNILKTISSNTFDNEEIDIDDTSIDNLNTDSNFVLEETNSELDELEEIDSNDNILLNSNNDKSEDFSDLVNEDIDELTIQDEDPKESSDISQSVQDHNDNDIELEVQVIEDDADDEIISENNIVLSEDDIVIKTNDIEKEEKTQQELKSNVPGKDSNKNTNENSLISALEEDSTKEEPIFQVNNGAKYNQQDSIDTLFKDQYSKKDLRKKQSSPIVPIVILAILGGLGYLGYSKYSSIISTSGLPFDLKALKINSGIFNKTNTEQISQNSFTPSNTQQVKQNIKPKVEAMPNETIENKTKKTYSNEGNSTSIPKIEQNLNASIAVENLVVNWEVPTTYASNSSAKRYMIKLGKIIQLNLKADLLLISRQPMTNKIAVKLIYNKDLRKFETAGFTISSGDKYIDDIIIKTINKALNMNLSINTDSFAKLQGNPVLNILL